MAIRHIVPVFLLFFSCAAVGTETVTLARYLSLAKESGINIVFSSDLVSNLYTVTYEPGHAVTLAGIERALTAFDLRLQPIDDQSWSVVHRLRVVAPAPVETAAGSAPARLPVVEEVVVQSSQYRLVKADDASGAVLQDRTLRDRPATANDAVRLINQLPGMASTGISARPRVRGGKEDEMLILFDGVQLYNPFHFGNFNSLVSGFDHRIIDSIDFRSGGFPVSLGDRLSAAMLIQPKVIEADQREVGAGLFTASWQAQASGDDREWLVNVRRSSLELWSNAWESDGGDPSFADLYGHYAWHTAGGDDIAINVLWLGDDIEINNNSRSEVAGSVDSSTYVWVKWDSAPTPDLVANTLVSMAVVKNDREGQVERTGQASGTLHDHREFQVYSMQRHYQYVPDDAWLLAFGADYRYASAEYESASHVQFAPAFAALGGTTGPRDTVVDLTLQGHQFAAFANLKRRITRRITTEFGLRLDGQEDAYRRDLQFSPRFSLRFEPLRGTAIRYGWGRYSQATGLHELHVFDGEQAFRPAQNTLQQVVGIQQRFGDHISMRLEAYRKKGQDGSAYDENLSNPRTLLPELQADSVHVVTDGFVARGLELSVAGEHGDLEWWANYTRASTRDEIGGEYIHRSWDQVHTGNAGVIMPIGAWRVSISVTAHSGWLTTPLIYDGTRVTAAARNSERFGHFASLDLKATRHWLLGQQKISVEAGVTNLLGRDNLVAFEYALNANALTRQPKAGLPMTPFIDVYWQF